MPGRAQRRRGREAARVVYQVLQMPNGGSSTRSTSCALGRVVFGVLEGDGAELPLLPAALAGGVVVVVLGVAEDGVAPEVHAVLRRLRLELQEEMAP